MSGHLTGWRLSAGDEHTVFDGNQRKIAAIACGGMSGRTFAEAADTARLIAAAPMLMEGAQDAVEAFKTLRIGMLDNKAAVEVIDAHIDELKYAIAKVKT